MKPIINTIYEDDHFIVLNKAAPLLTIPDRYQVDKPNLYNLLQAEYGEIFIVHRLDKETSGTICFAKTAKAHQHLSQQFEHRKVEKIYHAIVMGTPAKEVGKIDVPIAKHSLVSGKMIAHKRGKEAVTHYRIKEHFKQYSLLEVQIETGRTHQIRVHLAYLNHPLAVDQLYGQQDAFYLSSIKSKKSYQPNRHDEERPLMTRISLHARELKLEHPNTGEVLTFESSYPKDFRAMLRQLQKWSK